MRTVLMFSVVVAGTFLTGCDMNTFFSGGVDGSASSSSSVSSASSSVSSASSPSSAAQQSSGQSVQAAVVSSAVSSVQASSVPAALRTIKMGVTNFEFNPKNIVVQKGERVRIELADGEGIHSFAIPALRINERVEPGQTIYIDVPTDMAGTFDFRCAIPCGPGHMEMKGILVVQ